MNSVSVYVDVSNIAMNGGYGLRFDVLRDFAARDEDRIVHLNAYVSYDRQRAERDNPYFYSQQRFHSALRDFGYKIMVKDVQRFEDPDGTIYRKSNVDLEMATHMLLQSGKGDKIVLCTGDGDFSCVVEALQNIGCRIEVVAFENVSHVLKCACDMYFSGYLIPGLLPTSKEDTYRGVCFVSGNDGGLFRVLLPQIGKSIMNMDTRSAESPYIQVAFLDKDLPKDTDFRQLPSRSQIFEFEAQESADGYKATCISIVTKGA